MDDMFDRVGEDGGSEIDPFEGDVNSTDEDIEYEEISHSSDSSAFEPGEGYYCPAFSVLMSTVYTSDSPEDLQLEEGRLTWWEDESLLPDWPVTLVNPLTWAQSNPVPEDMTRDVLNMHPEEKFVFADSGGFQVKSFDDMCVVDSPDLHSFEGKRIMPEKLLEWQVKNASAGAILDFSPYTVDSNQGETEGLAGHGPEQFENEDFYPNLRQTVENAERMYDHRQRIGASDYDIYNVLHGLIPMRDGRRPDHYLQEWFDAVDGIGEFDGWGIGGGSTNIGKLALALAFTAEKIDESHLHFFGTGSLPFRSIIEYWRVFNGEDYAITSDSTSFEVGSQYRQFFNPMMHGNDICVSKRSEDRENIVADTVPCTCVVCNAMESEFGRDWIWQRDDAQIGVAINMHNLNLFMQRHRMTKSIINSTGERLPDLFDEDSRSQTSSEFWNMYSQLFSDETIRDMRAAMKFIRRSEKDGYEAALDDFVFGSPYTDEKGPLIYERDVGGFAEW